MRLSGIGRIGVLRANRIGDVLFTLPALEALRAAYPSAEIVFLGARLAHALFEDRPSPVDRVITVPTSVGVNTTDGAPASADTLEAFFAAMRREHFDLVLQMHGGGHYSNPFARRLGARITAGFRARDAEPLDLWVPYIYFHPERLRYLELASLVGAPPVTLDCHLTATPRDIAEAAAAVQISGDETTVLLHPVSSDPRRCWPPESFAEVADALADRGARILINGVASERERTRRVAAAMRHRPIDLAGRLSLRGLIGLLARCDLVVGNDSGPLHLADALGVPSVGLYWCGNLINSTPLTRTRHRPLGSWQLECSLCGANCMTAHCDHPVSFVSDIDPADVLAAALELLDAPRQAEAACSPWAASA